MYKVINKIKICGKMMLIVQNNKNAHIMQEQDYKFLLELENKRRKDELFKTI